MRVAKLSVGGGREEKVEALLCDAREHCSSSGAEGALGASRAIASLREVGSVTGV